MKAVLPLAAAVMMVSSAAIAQTTTTTPAPSTTPSVTVPAVTATKTMTDQEAQSWVNKVVYSSDNKNVGEIAEIRRDTTGKINELRADVGGFLGLGETRVIVMPTQFSFGDDRVVLNLTSEQVKELPKVEK